jgi:diguanylate cyclase (GGDEF)-like protein
MKALIIVANPRAGQFVVERLREIGCVETIVVTSSEEALCAARSRHADFDLVVLDLEVCDGLQLCRRLSALLTGAPIVACCAHATDDVLAQVYEAGAHDLVTTPFHGRELSLRAGAALRLREEQTRRMLHQRRLVHRARQLEKSKRELESTVCVDQLTGIANRRHFDSMLRAEWRRATRNHSNVSLVFFDIDDFHRFNERYGHVGGDACLARVARTLAHGLRRASDVLARFGGEEFVAVLADTSVDGACVVAERLRANIEELQIPHAASTCGSVLTLSAGVATRVATGDDTPESLVEAADAALYRAKHDGRNRCRADGVDAEHVSITRRPWPPCPVVVLDPLLVQRVPSFLATTRAELSAMRVVGTNVQQLRATAARIRRASSSLGFEDIAALVVGIDEHAQRGDGVAALDAIAQLAWYVDHVQVVYRRAAAAAG